jgi:hypothetical protein
LPQVWVIDEELLDRLEFVRMVFDGPPQEKREEWVGVSDGACEESLCDLYGCKWLESSDGASDLAEGMRMGFA